MTLFGKLISYIHLRRLGVRNAWTHSPLLAIDYVLILVSVCVLLIAITLHYADKIDNAFKEQVNKTNKVKIKLSQAYAQNLHNERLASFNESLVVSMLNGSIVVNGRVKSLCVYDAGGDCK